MAGPAATIAAGRPVQLGAAANVEVPRAPSIRSRPRVVGQFGRYGTYVHGCPHPADGVNAEPDLGA